MYRRLLAFAIVQSVAGIAADRPPNDPEIERKIDALLARMSPEE